MALNGHLKICLVIVLEIGFVLGDKACNNNHGYTTPRGDIVLQYGEDLDITCTIYDEILKEYGENASSRLYFSLNNKSIPREMIEVLNSASIRLHISKHPKVKENNYYCLFRAKDDVGVYTCLNVVVVGVAPQNVTDFSCIGRNYDNLTCTWTPPETYVNTNYNLTYTLPGFRASRFVYSCPKLTKMDNGQMSCFWNISTTPQYRQSHNKFNFQLHMENQFGLLTNNFAFDHFEHVLPNPPENLTALATSPYSIELSWVVPSSMKSFPKGLHHRVLFQCEYYEKKWQFGGLIEDAERNKTLKYTLKNLKFAHAVCDIRVSMRSAVAHKNDEYMWSSNATRTARTLSDIPDCPPKTNIGSFEIVNNGLNRDAYIYWQQIQEDQQNGQNFSYTVEVKNHPLMKPIEMTKAYAKFQNFSFTRNYTINVWSKNEIGLSIEKSQVFIPAKRVSEPLNFIKVAHSNTLYELSWEPPYTNSTEITNYTIFWCNNERDRPYQCVGKLKWQMVPNNTFSYNQTLTEHSIYQFAISANTHSSSSGMSWAECTVIANRKMAKVKKVWVKRVGSTFIEVGWSLDCYKLGQIQKFNIFYCPVVSLVQPDCTQPLRNVTIGGENEPGSKIPEGGIITGLTPDSTYRITVNFMVHSSYSQHSEPLYNVTNEDAPSTPPVNIEIYDVTNSSVSIKWDPPVKINGKIKYYRIYYNDRTKDAEKHQTRITLTDLKSYVNYSISLEACTVFCSNRSEPMAVMTKMWLPGEIVPPPAIVNSNATHAVIGWSKPVPPRGEINYYQVQFRETPDYGNSTKSDYINETRQNYTIDCGNAKYNSYFVSVRAVNIIDGEAKAGPWSKAFQGSCTQYSLLVYIIFGFLVVIFVAVLFYALRRFYIYCKAMQDVEIKLPPGLAPVVEQRDLVPWGSEKHTEDIERTSRADEELLLEKISEIRMSGDSSGCSSGHESITSSLGSATHMSSSDSGTEQPRSPTLSDEIRRNSLRQRNVSASRPTINKGYVMPDAVANTNWAQKPVLTPAGNYCVLGVDPSTQTEKDPPYVPITDTNTKIPYISCDMSSTPPPYVVTGDLVKTPNPGYVPYTSTTEPADKNTGYVVAGIKKDLLVPDLLQCDTHQPTSIEEKPLYVQADNFNNIKGVQFPWQQPPLATTLPKTGYVSVGDAPPPPKTISEVSKGYVPHRQFEAKSLKED